MSAVPHSQVLALRLVHSSTLLTFDEPQACSLHSIITNTSHAPLCPRCWPHTWGADFYCWYAGTPLPLFSQSVFSLFDFAFQVCCAPLPFRCWPQLVCTVAAGGQLALLRRQPALPIFRLLTTLAFHSPIHSLSLHCALAPYQMRKK